MRILFVIDTLGAGGAERSLQEMMPLLVEEGIQPVIACLHRRDEGVEHLVFGQHDVRVLSGKSRLGQIRSIRRIIRDERIDLVHTSLFEADVFGRTATAGTGVAVVTSLVNMPYEPSRLAHDRNVDPVKLFMVRWLEAGTGALFADQYHAITHAVRDAAVAHLRIAPKRIAVVYRGRDERRLGLRNPERRAKTRAVLGIADDAKVVLNVGRQEFQKGQRFLVQAFRHFVDTEPRAVLLIAGRKGSATRDLEVAAAHPSLRGHVHFLGHRDDVPDLMVAADLFALPSLWEGLGGVLIEAMALELPIVGSDIESVREATDDGKAAVLVSPQDPVALASAISKVMTEREERERLTRNGRALYEERYTLEQSVRGMLGIFGRAMEIRGRRLA